MSLSTSICTNFQTIVWRQFRQRGAIGSRFFRFGGTVTTATWVVQIHLVFPCSCIIYNNGLGSKTIYYSLLKLLVQHLTNTKICAENNYKRKNIKSFYNCELFAHSSNFNEVLVLANTYVQWWSSICNNQNKRAKFGWSIQYFCLLEYHKLFIAAFSVRCSPTCESFFR